MSEQIARKPGLPKWLSAVLTGAAFLASGLAVGWLVGNAANAANLDLDLNGELLDLGLQQAKGLPETVQPLIFAEAAYFAARHRQDSVAARLLLEQAQGGLIEKHSRLRAEAAVLLAEGKPVESATKARTALLEAGKSWDKDGAAAEKDWLMDLLQRANAPDARLNMGAAL